MAVEMITTREQIGEHIALLTQHFDNEPGDGMFYFAVMTTSGHLLYAVPSLGHADGIVDKDLCGRLYQQWARMKSGK